MLWKSISVLEHIHLLILSGNTPVVEDDNSLRFTSCSFNTEAFGTRLLEAKSRFNRTDPSGTSDKSARLTEMGLFSLLCRDASPLLDRAFGEQNTHIALVNLSHSEYGFLLTAHSLVNHKEYGIKKALGDAVGLSRNGTDAVVLYLESSGGTSEHFGITLPKKTVKDLGRSLDAIENILRKTGKPFDFYDTAYIAQNADAWIQEVKRREGML